MIISPLGGAGGISPPAPGFFGAIWVMARYEHLPIYKKAMDLTIYFEKVVRNFSRYHKYTLGSELREKSREIVGLIIKANFTVGGEFRGQIFILDNRKIF